METSNNSTIKSQLGFVENYADQPRKSDGKGPSFDYLLVIDFEATCWEKKVGILKYAKPEIIEFPAVLINMHSGEVEEEFHKYILPTVRPKLSDFCKKLTGIEQEKLESEGIPLAACLSLFSSWVEEISRNRNIFFHSKDNKSVGKVASVATWSDWDISLCLANECQRKRLAVPKVFMQWMDVRKVYQMFYGQQPCGLNGALKQVGLTFEGQPHSGICDARNTAKLAYRLEFLGADLRLTGSL